MAFHRIFQRLTQLVFIGHVVFDRIVIKPITLIILTNFAVLTPQIATGREFFDCAAYRNQGFHFRRDVEVTVFVVPHIQWDDPDVIATNQISVLFAVVQGKSKHAL